MRMTTFKEGGIEVVTSGQGSTLKCQCHSPLWNYIAADKCPKLVFPLMGEKLFIYLSTFERIKYVIINVSASNYLLSASSDSSFN